MALYASTLGGMKARIAAELRRSDLSTQIECAINDAILEYAKERLRFSDTIPDSPPTFDTVDAQSIYTSADNANIASAMKIDYVTLAVGNTLTYLVRQQPVVLKLWNQEGTMSGQPTWYAYEGNELILSPIPNDVWEVTLGLFRNVAAPAADDTAGNAWMTDGERLIRSRAKYEIALHVTRNPTMAEAMSPFPPEENGGKLGAAYAAWRALKREANRITGTSKVRAMAF